MADQPHQAMTSLFAAFEKVQRAHQMGSPTLGDALDLLSRRTEEARAAVIGTRPGDPGDEVVELLTLISMVYDGTITPDSGLWKERVRILLGRRLPTAS